MTRWFRANHTPVQLGKWWPGQPETASNYVERRDADDRLIVADIQEKITKHHRLETAAVQQNNPPTDTHFKHRVALVGMGGVGKTTTANHFCQTYEVFYQHIIWINSEGEKLEESIKQLADRCQDNCLNPVKSLA